MGPRPVRRGQPKRADAEKLAGFRLQWVHGLFAVGNRKTARPSTCRCVMLQWVHGLFAVGNGQMPADVQGPRGSFNGSTACSPWATSIERIVETPIQPRFNGSTACSP